DLHIVSARAMADGGDPSAERDGIRMRRVLAGYARVPQLLAGGASHIRLRETVERIAWTRGGGTVSSRRAGRPRVSVARAAIVSVPLGVLQAAPSGRGAIAFDPALPASHRDAIAHLAMGHVARLAVQFRDAFWIEPRGGGSLPPRNLVLLHTSEAN